MSVSRIKLGAVLVGWITSLSVLLIIIAGVIGIALYLDVDLTSFLSGNSQYNGFFRTLAIFISIFISFFAGGYVAGRMAALAGAINGTMVVITSLLVLLLTCTFTVIVGNSLGIDVMSAIVETTSALTVALIITALFAIVGGILGGKLGEGYFMRLELTLARQEQSRKAKQTDEAKKLTPIQPKDEALDKELEHAS